MFGQWYSLAHLWWYADIYFIIILWQTHSSDMTALLCQFSGHVLLCVCQTVSKWIRKVLTENTYCACLSSFYHNTLATQLLQSISSNICQLLNVTIFDWKQPDTELNNVIACLLREAQVGLNVWIASSSWHWIVLKK